MSSSGGGSSPPVTRSASRPLDRSGGVFDRRVELDLRLAHANAGGLEREALHQGVRDGGRHRLEQPELPAFGHLADELDRRAVVDGLLDPVGRRLGELEPDVVEEGLLALPLPLLDPVAARDLEPGQLDDDAHAVPTARAAARASTCSRTSWTRRIVAPRP